MTPLGRPGTSPPAAQLRRVDARLDAYRMGPRLRAALGTGSRGGLLDHRAEAGDASRSRVDPGVRLFRFPADPGLPGLAGVVDLAAPAEALRSSPPGGGPVVRYRPEKRAGPR